MKRPGHDNPADALIARRMASPSLRAMGLFVTIAGSALTGCSAPSARHGGFESDNPASLIYAVHRAGESRDATAIPQLVQTLEHDDPAVRMMAITALENITGQRLAYNPYEPYHDRYPAILAWRNYVKQSSQAVADTAAPHP